ncbi:hypothetical protein XENTR_v10024539 [Xenopus tropicalis]|nr:hypothetical protein XENTR_v10024539 [Xenopus tropicalis]
MEEPVKQVVLQTAGEVSLQEGFSFQAMKMSSSRQEASFSSISETKSMSSKSEASFVEMSSSSFMEKSSLMQSSSSRMLTAGFRGIPPKIEALPNDVSIDEGKVLTVACAFSGEPTPDIAWSKAGHPVPTQEQKGRVHIETSEDLTTLIIMDIQKKDGGHYTLNLSNDFGSDSASVNINVRTH